MPDLSDLCRVAVGAAESGEAVEACAEESRRTEAKALGARSRPPVLRIPRRRRAGHPRVPARVRVGGGPGRRRGPRRRPSGAGERRALGGGRAQRPARAGWWTPIPDLYRESSVTVPTRGKTRLALDLEARAISRDPRVTKIDEAQVGDAVSRVAIASTTGVEAEYARTDAWCLAVTLAVEGDETQTGFSYRIARGLDELEWEAVADEAVERGARMLGAAKPTTARVPVVLDQFAAMSFLGVLAGALSADAVQKAVPCSPTSSGSRSGPSCSRWSTTEPTWKDRAPLRSTTKGCRAGAQAVHEGRAGRFPATRTPHKGGTDSTGNGKRGYPSGAGCGTSNFYLDARASLEELLRRAEGGVMIQDVSGSIPAPTRSVASSASARPGSGSRRRARSRCAR